MARKYVDGKKFTEVLNQWHAKKEAAIADQSEIPRTPEFVGEGLFNIAKNFATSYKFSRVPFKDRDDLISEGVMVALNAIQKKYDPTKMKTGNAFSFATTATYFGFLGVIQNSKKQFDIRNELTSLFADGQATISSSIRTDHQYHASAMTDIRKLTDNYNSETELDKELDYSGNFDAKIKAVKVAEALEKQEELDKLNPPEPITLNQEIELERDGFDVF